MREMKKFLAMSVLALSVLTLQAQNRYIVKTKGAVKKTATVADDSQSAEEAEEEEKDFLSQYFHYVSMCDWQDGMRFMVIPDKKDMVIKTFADANTGQMVSSSTLRHKIMIYRGHQNTGSLHERVDFECEDDGRRYYFEVPTASFDDYCFGKLGVPTLAYLGDVDTAIQLFKDKTLLTLADEYYVDTDVDGDGYRVLTDIPKNMEVKVVAVGVGTRNFPVKIIVADEQGNEFFQNVAISRTNSGMRDDEFEISNMKFHTFRGAFEMLGDGQAPSSSYKRFIGTTVFTLFNTDMVNANGQKTKVARLSTFKVKSIRAQRGTDYVKMTLIGNSSGTEYTKEVTFKNKNVAGEPNKQYENYFHDLFAQGNPATMEGVRQANLKDVQKGLVRVGYSENEVRLALGKPSTLGQTSDNQYTWVYNYPGQPYTCVVFNPKTRKVAKILK